MVSCHVVAWCTSFLESSERSEAIGKGAWWFNHQAYVTVSLTYQMTSRDFPWLVVCTDITVWRFCRHNPDPPFVLRSLVMIQSPCIILSSLVSIFRARLAALSKTFRRGREKFGLGTITDPECKLVTWLRAPPPQIFSARIHMQELQITAQLEALHRPPFEYFCKLDPFYSIAITFSCVPILKTINAVEWKWSAFVKLLFELIFLFVVLYFPSISTALLNSSGLAS